MRQFQGARSYCDQTCRFSCVIAESYARIFYRNAINIGLPIIISPQAAQEIKEGDQVDVDMISGRIVDQTTQKEYQGEPFPAFMLEILNEGGLVPYVRKKVQAND